MKNMRSSKKKAPAVSVSVLPGQPTNGSGVACIHLFVLDEHGPIIEPHVMHPVIGNDGKPTGKLYGKPTRGRLACDPKRTIAPFTKNGVLHVTLRTDMCEAVTCIKCKTSKDFLQAHIYIPDRPIRAGTKEG